MYPNITHIGDDDTLTAHLVVDGRRVYLARQAPDLRWYADEVGGGQAFGPLKAIKHCARSWASLAGAKRALRREHGSDLAFAIFT